MISTVASAATAPPLARARAGPLRLRLLSAVVLAPVALAAVWFGSPYVRLLVLVAMALMSWEWARLVTAGRLGATGFFIIAGDLAALSAFATGAGAGVALGVAALAAALVGGAAGALRAAEPLWAALGTLWLAAGGIAFLALATPPLGDRGTAMWLLGLVWATDSFAYAAGRGIGGPRLAPRFSPNKTWAGLLGGMAGAAVVGVVAAWQMAAPRAPLALFSAALAVAAQAGDLAESAAKRHYGVKDMSGLIPGHGGLLDRVDGLLAAAIAAALVAIAVPGGGLALGR